MHVLSKVILTMLGCAVLTSGTVLADVYKYRDSTGHIHLTDKPMRGMKLLMRYSLPTRQGYSKRRPSSGAVMALMKKRRDILAPLIKKAADDNRLRPALVHAVVRAESAYRADAVSSKGAVGLMQLMPATAERFGVTNPRDPAQNLRGGTTYLRELLEMFDNDLQLALAAYNAGENAVMRYGNKIPPYPETQGYVRKVIRFYQAMGASDKLALR